MFILLEWGFVEHACGKNEQGFLGVEQFLKYATTMKNMKWVFTLWVFVGTNSSYFDIGSVWGIFTAWMSRQMDFDYQDY